MHYLNQFQWVSPLVGRIPSKENVTDFMIKVLYGQKRKYLVINILYDIYHNQ